MFEKASRMKLRFSTPLGSLAAEDLWDLPLTSLNATAVDLHHTLKDDTISFINPEQKPDEAMQLRFDIARHVIEVRLAEREAANQARERAEKKQKILGILARKQDAALESASEDELRGLLADL